MHAFIKTFYGFHKECLQMLFSLTSHLKVLKLASITLCCLLYLQHNFWLIMEGFVITEISPLRCTTYQLFLPYISWSNYKYHHTPITFCDTYSCHGLYIYSMIYFKWNCCYSLCLEVRFGRELSWLAGLWISLQYASLVLLSEMIIS